MEEVLKMKVIILVAVEVGCWLEVMDGMFLMIRGIDKFI